MMTAVLGFIIGSVLGSFAQAAAGRVMSNRSVLGRSYCESCQKQLRWYDLFPIFSYLFLKGRCRFCHKKIPLENFLTEAVLGLIGALVIWTTLSSNAIPFTQLGWQHIFLGVEIIFKLFIVAVLIIVFITDLKTGYIFDKVTFPAVFISLGYLISIAILKSVLFYQQVLQNSLGKYLLPPYSGYLTDQLLRLWTGVGINIISGLGAALFFLFLVMITRGKGMGLGDVKFAIFLGLVLGFPNTIIALFLAFLLGAIISVFLIIFGKKKFGQTIPFGPFLSLGALIALLFGEQIIEWYLTGFKLG